MVKQALPLPVVYVSDVSVQLRSTPSNSDSVVFCLLKLTVGQKCKGVQKDYLIQGNLWLWNIHWKDERPASLMETSAVTPHCVLPSLLTQLKPAWSVEETFLPVDSIDFNDYIFTERHQYGTALGLSSD